MQSSSQMKPTSTVIDEIDWRNIEKSEVPEILLKISAIEMKVSSFPRFE